MVRVHIITALNRFENLPELRALTARQERAHWHLIIDDSYGFSPVFHDAWATGYCAPIGGDRPFWEQCHRKLNWFIENHVADTDDFYCFMNDDDALEEGLCAKVGQVTDADVVMVSLKRGQHTPAGAAPERAHGTSTLIAAPENMRLCCVSLQQIFARGRVLRKYRIPMHIAGDGELIATVNAQEKARYEPEWYAYFNYLEPGRWVR